MTILNWSAVGLACAYGGVSALAGVLQLFRRLIPTWSATALAFSGVCLTAAALASMQAPSMGLWAIPGLLALQVMAVVNGLHLHGRIHGSHHLVRFVLSSIIAILLA